MTRDKPAGDKRGTGKQPKGNPSQALNRLLKYLLPIAGKRILVLFALAIVRTALSNRLARMQVLSLGPSLLVVAGEASKNAVCVSTSAITCRGSQERLLAGQTCLLQLCQRWCRICKACGGQ